ncbi:patatin-like phospholipase [Novosphingobium sp. PhB165]|uniref:patatin-like phospholipase family protein n=1 Tax=Novosphingobium sp. PhB165 TaxID=2485105 RepID=UPI0010E0450E|nr:patatin-like phospholipase family protein [Novosphingobium sp. PhB165]TCM14386.1 patatin-like phospholipase [Novosphingobium sp. PhB165]
MAAALTLANRRMSFSRLLAAMLMSSMLAACATMPPRSPYSVGDLAQASAVQAQPVRFWAKGDDAAYRRWGEILRQDRAESGLAAPATLLALSGGSDKGAFGAGLLTGWSRTGTRPEFDIVTGVSTGALIAPFAFLGSAEDPTLTAIYTNISSKDIYRKRVLGGLLGGPSLLDSRPLAALIARYVTPALLDRIAAEHRRGRRLLVMTTQLDAQQGTIWDMSAIAASNEPERAALFRRVLLASASIPGAFPPVLIDTTIGGRRISEMHVDGGAIGGFFTLPTGLIAANPAAPRSNAAIFLIYNGVLEPDFEVVKPRTLTIMSHALGTVLGQLDRNNADELKAFARDRGIPFHLCALVPAEIDTKAPLFDRDNMRTLYAIGEARAGQATGCLKRPAQPDAGLAP